MKKTLYAVIVSIILIFNSLCANSQKPSWSVNPDNFQHSMTIVGEISINTVASTDVNDQIAAFVGTECRGVANLAFFESNGKYLIYLIVYGNTESEKLEFKLYDASADVVFTPVTNLTFSGNANLGTPDSPFAITNETFENHAPVFSSSPSVTLVEKNTFVEQQIAQDLDNDEINYAIVGGEDKDLFVLVNNQLQFISSPEIAKPLDADKNNVYLVDIQATDGKGGTVVQTITVTVQELIQIPTASLSRTTGSGSVSSTFNVTITFSSAVTGFELSDIVVINGIASNFVTVSDLVYTADITPNRNGDIVISIPANSVSNPSGNQTSNLLVVSYLSTAIEHNIADIFTVYPNPSNGEFRVSLKEDGSLYYIEINNVNGQLIYKNITHTMDAVNLTGKKGSFILTVKKQNGFHKSIPLVLH